jgi:S1-C subfamily serine protease
LPSLPAGLAAARVVSAADDSPLQPGDVVLTFDGEPFFAAGDSITFLHSYLWRTRSRTVHLKLLRLGEPREITLPLW